MNLDFKNCSSNSNNFDSRNYFKNSTNVDILKNPVCTKIGSPVEERDDPSPQITPQNLKKTKLSKNKNIDYQSPRDNVLYPTSMVDNNATTSCK